MKFGHVGITVSNIKRSTEFYHLAFGFVPFFDVDRTERWVGDIVGYEKTRIRFQHMRIEGVMHLELMQYCEPHEMYEHRRADTYLPGNCHFSLFVDDIHKWIDSALAAGAVCASRHIPTMIESGPNKGALVVYLRDPDGVTIELFQEAK